MSGLADLKLEEPTPLQNEAIPKILQGGHWLVKNEMGDTGVFLIPALQKVISRGEVSDTRILILTPTVERAKLIDEAVWALGYHAQISSASLSMKGNRDEQEQAVVDKAPVIAANPGRLIEILEKNNLSLPGLDIVIIDDAQAMGNYNLVKRTEEIFKKITGEPQVLIFAESENEAVKQLSDKLQNDAEVIGFEQLKTQSEIEEPDAAVLENSRTEKTDATADDDFELDMDEVNRKLEQASVKVVLNPEEVKEESSSQKAAENKNGKSPVVPSDLSQAYIYVPPRAKISTLLAHLENSLTDNIVVFTASKRTTDRLFRIIRKQGMSVVSIDNYTSKEVFEERFSKFKNGEMDILLAGGITATELDLANVKQVINYDVPGEVEEYKYRASLVGGGRKTQMVSLVSKIDKKDMDEIVEQVGHAPVEIPLPEEVKEKKKRKREPSQSRKSSGPSRQKKVQQKKKESSNGLPRPTYDGLSGGREGNRKRPAPSEGGGAFGWIKKLFK